MFVENCSKNVVKFPIVSTSVLFVETNGYPHVHSITSPWVFKSEFATSIVKYSIVQAGQ